MCELMGICANLKVNSQFSFKEMKNRGGGSGPHKDGWGIGVYDGSSSNIIKEDKPAFESKKAKDIESGSVNLTSKILVCHIRRSSSSEICLENTQPFMRRLFDKDWLFVHNGGHGLESYYNSHNKPVNSCFNLEGETGSEKGFVLILNELKKQNANNIGDQREIIKKLANKIAISGAEFNIIMSNSEYLFCYPSEYEKLFYVERSYENDRHLNLIDAGFEVDISEMKTRGEKAIIVATKPLTKGEDWKKISPRTLIIFKDGSVF